MPKESIPACEINFSISRSLPHQFRQSLKWRPRWFHHCLRFISQLKSPSFMDLSPSLKASKKSPSISKKVDKSPSLFPIGQSPAVFLSQSKSPSSPIFATALPRFRQVLTGHGELLQLPLAFGIGQAERLTAALQSLKCHYCRCCWLKKK